MTKAKKALLDLKLSGDSTCPVHRVLVEVLDGFDKRLLRVEVLLLVVAAASVGSFGKEVILPLLKGLVGG